MGLGSCGALALWLNFTTSGLHVRAVSQDPSVARMMGINADRLSLLVTSLSAAFAGVAGVLAGPYLSVDPGMDVTMIVSCLIIVVIGGAGSIAGAIVAALLYRIRPGGGIGFPPRPRRACALCVADGRAARRAARNRARAGARLNGEAAARVTFRSGTAADASQRAGRSILTSAAALALFAVGALAPQHVATDFVLRLADGGLLLGIARPLAWLS